MNKFKKMILLMVVMVTILIGASSCTFNMEQADGTLLEEIANLQKQVSELQNTINNNSSKENNDNQLASNYGEEAFEMIKYIDATVKDRDSIAGEQYQLAQKWIVWNLMEAGYKEGQEIEYHNFTWNSYVKNSTNIVSPYTTDGKLYARQGWQYVESEEGTFIKAEITGTNIVVTKQGKSDKQIIVGAHYDGDGTGDNGSGISLGLVTAMNLFNVETEYTIVFVFFDAEEYGMKGSTAYANDMSDEDIANTLYMINMDSLVCGDYCYLYGGVQNKETETVTDTEAYYNAMAVAESLGLNFKSNPWTYENPAPGYDKPDYAFPSTGDWSDHVGFKEVGIKYLYFEATNWDIPGPYNEYDGYGETYLIGMLMNTENDYLEYIEKYFPGRILDHITQFSTLLNALVMQSDVNF